MSTSITNRRGQDRISVSGNKLAEVEFRYPSSRGRAFKQPILNLSASGLSFGFEDGEELIRLEEGVNLDRSVMRIGGCEIRGDMLVMHVTNGSPAGYVCGALFYPATDTDLVKLKSVIAGMEVVGTD